LEINPPEQGQLEAFDDRGHLHRQISALPFYRRWNQYGVMDGSEHSNVPEQTVGNIVGSAAGNEEDSVAIERFNRQVVGSGFLEGKK
jgi:hypothetical protein